MKFRVALIFLAVAVMASGVGVTLTRSSSSTSLDRPTIVIPEPVVKLASFVSKPKVHHRHRVAPRMTSGRVNRHASGSLMCNPHHWKRLLDPREQWIDKHESGIRPEARNGRYWGLGQMDYAVYEVTMNPCVQVADQRHYMIERYGSWDAAIAHWEQNSWW